jgi:hypothetical protein
MTNASALKFIAFFATIFVSAFAFSSPKPRVVFSELGYQEFKPRLLVQATQKVVSHVVRDPSFINAKLADYVPELAFTDDLLPIQPGEIFRVLYTSAGDDLIVMAAGQAEDTGSKLYRFTLQRVDRQLRPFGKPFEIATKAPPETVVQEFKALKDDLVSQTQSLVYKRARVKDVLLNISDITTRQGLIPANSRATIVRITSERASWSFAHNYHLIVRVSPCPASLVRTKCHAQLDSSGYLPDTSWGHWVHPSNVRKVRFLGIEAYY